MTVLRHPPTSDKEADVQISIIAQPWTQLGNEISTLLESRVYEEIRFVSAFVGLRSVLRFKQSLTFQIRNNASVCFVVGIDLGGTSQEVLSELLQWNARTFVVHNPIPRVTFHPKFYFFKSHDRATLFLGSNNWTEGGLYTNYEVCTRYDFILPEDNYHLAAIMEPLSPYIEPGGPCAARLTAELINVLSARGTIVTETEARKRRNQKPAPQNENGLPPNPFMPVAPAFPPNLPSSILNIEQQISPPPSQPIPAGSYAAMNPIPTGALVWRKILSASEALKISNDRTNPVGGIRLTQARFETVHGRIDQTTYFRNLFADYPWQRELGRNRNTTQEATVVPIRVVIRGLDYGVHSFEISHKPDGEADQNNYTTIIRWGRYFMEEIPTLNLEGATLSLYATSSQDVRFLMEIA